MESAILRDSAESLLLPGVAGGCSVRCCDRFFDLQWWETVIVLVVRLLAVMVLEVRVSIAVGIVGVLVVSSSLCTL